MLTSKQIESGKTVFPGCDNSSGNRENCIPYFSLDTADFDKRDQLDVWHDYTMPLFEVSPINPCGFSAAVEVWKTARLIFASYRMEQQTWNRKQELIGSDKTEYVILRYYRTGGMRGTLDGDALAMSTGEIHLFDLSNDMQCAADACEHVSVFIPYSEIGYDPSLYPLQITIPTGAPVGRILLSMLLGIMSALPRASRAEGNELSDALTGMLRGILACRRANSHHRSHFERARDHAMRAYIRENLAEPEIGLNTLSRKFGASKATISRIFASSGGVGQYIAQQRLERAYWHLSQSRVERGDIQDVAMQYGYLDPNSFTRAFRKRFGVVPTDVANTAAQLHRPMKSCQRANCCIAERYPNGKLVELLGISEH